MSSASYMEELDFGSFFDHIDDLADFNETINCNDFPSIWTDALPVSDDPIFSGGSAAADLSPALPAPREDIAHLEWLSNFVEDSFAGGGLTMNNGAYPFKGSAMAGHKFQISSPVSVLESSSGSGSGSSSSSSSSSGSGGKVMTLSPTKPGTQRARSKRPRPATFNPRPAIQQLISPSPEPVLIPVPILSSASENIVELSDCIVTKQKKKAKKMKETNQDQNQKPGPASPRKCMHCEITKTPQWRAGPMGPKTLCNACGVRFKSGRLFPEYRPAASPTFVPSIHSNSHKKVVEMRTKGTENAEPSPQLIPIGKASAE